MTIGELAAMTTEQLAAAVGVRKGDVWTWAPSREAEQDVEIIGFGVQGGDPVIETRGVMRGGYVHKSTYWNELTHFVHMAVFTCEVADRDRYDKDRPVPDHLRI